MGYEKIHCVNHVGKNLLIVGYSRENQWEFKAVTQAGKTVNQVNQFATAEEAEQQGYNWIYHNLLDNPN